MYLSPVVDCFDGYLPTWTISLHPNAYLVNKMLPDNLACEELFGRLKNEFFYCRDWMGTSLEEFIRELDEYLQWHNKDRIKKTLGFKIPIGYRVSLENVRTPDLQNNYGGFGLKYTEKQISKMASPINQSEEEKCKNAIRMVRDAMKKLNYTDDGKGIRSYMAESYSYAE